MAAQNKTKLQKQEARDRYTKSAKGKATMKRCVANWARLHLPELIARNKRRRTARREFVSKIKLLSGCVDCGYNSHAVALDFDHIDKKQKTHSISYLAANGSDARLFAEILKCEVRCANCHRIKTFNKGDHK